MFLIIQSYILYFCFVEGYIIYFFEIIVSFTVYKISTRTYKKNCPVVEQCVLKLNIQWVDLYSEIFYLINTKIYLV